jgi:outer membrane protein OmpA-like peptidoglycan-associated protein
MEHLRACWFKACICALILLCGASAAQAQARDEFALDQFQPAPSQDRFFAVQSTTPTGELRPALWLVSDYAHRPLVLYKNGGEDSIGAVVSDRWLLHLGGELSLWNRLGVSVDVPAVLASGGEDRTPAGAGTFEAPQGAALGDLRLGARLRLIGTPEGAVSVGLAGYVWLPTGDASSLASDGSARGLPSAVVSGRIGSFVYAANAGVMLRPAASYADTELNNQLSFGAAAGVLLLDDRLLLGPETYGTTAIAGEDSFGRGNTNFEAVGGARYRVGPIVLGAAAGPGISKGLGTPALRVLASVAFVPEPRQDEPADRDRDGILDAADSCPDAAGAPSAKRAEHGCPDRDRDGVRDPQDACVDLAGKADPDPAKNGCPEVDTDQDGIADGEDACPKVKGVKSSNPERNGCPADRDGDGIADLVDACPDVPGVSSGTPSEHGCPPDTDGDGIRDDRDACPREKGPANEDATKNGCPSLVRVTAAEILILEQVRFRTASDVILPESAELLAQVAAVLREHPELTQIEVQGHTDNRGGRAYNQNLSQRRAASVVKWLTTKESIAAERLTPRGYGMDRPLASNDDEEGRQKNRRVEFKLIGREGAASTESKQSETDAKEGAR